MVVVHPPHRARSARRGRLVSRLSAGSILAILGFAALTTGVSAPTLANVDYTAFAPVESASLTYSGQDVIITGSIDHIFKGESFTGPNIIAKQDRPRINVDAAAFASTFTESRSRLAALRHPELENAGGATMAVASLGPAGDSAALAAIEGMMPDQSVPMPALASDQLAYARANEPVTDLSAASTQYSQKELWCMATAIYFEARGESYRGQVAVAQVVMNRTKHKLYPKTICGVVFQNEHKRNACQFSFACDGRPETVNDQKAWAQAQDIALKVTNNELYLAEVGNATHYHATYVYPDWAPKMTKMTKVGLHVFYRFKRGWSFG